MTQRHSDVGLAMIVTLSKQAIKSRISQIVENHGETIPVPHLLVTISNYSASNSDGQPGHNDNPMAAKLKEVYRS